MCKDQHDIHTGTDRNAKVQEYEDTTKVINTDYGVERFKILNGLWLLNKGFCKIHPLANQEYYRQINRPQNNGIQYLNLTRLKILVPFRSRMTVTYTPG